MTMGHSDRCAWHLAIDNAPARVEAVLHALTRTVVGCAVIRGRLLDDDYEQVGDELVLSLRLDDDDASGLLRALGASDVVTLGEQYGHHWHDLDGVELVVMPGLLVVEYAEDVYPNNRSWPLPLLVAEYVAGQLGGEPADQREL
jgi:hypothetical protein